MKNLLIAALFILISVSAHAQQAALPIKPITTNTVSVTTSASAAALVPQATGTSWQIELQNTGTQAAYCAFGGSTIAATTSSYPVQPGVDKVVTVDLDRKYISCITASSTTTVYVTGGVGN